MPRPPASIRNSGGSSRPRLVNREQPAAQTTSSEPEATPTPLFPEEETGSANLEEQAALSAFRRSQARAEAEANPQPPVRAIQPQLFSINSKGELISPAAEIPALSLHSPLNVARWWFRSHLEQLNRPKNTIASYMYDLAGFEEFTGPKPLSEVTSGDVAAYLAQSQKKSTRKRRLTSLGAFFKYLIQTEKVLDRDPTDNFFADFIPLKTPVVLTQAEQTALLDTAARENSRTYLMIYFMLKLGFTRTELLAIQPEHVDVSDLQHPQVYVAYDDKRWQKKERKLVGAAELGPAYQRYFNEFKPSRKLFEMLPQSVNKLVERVARDAELNKKVTPQSLRDTFAVEEARNGANTIDLLKILGLAPDPRNRMSVERYLKLATAA
jgi:integrase/recombinase XerD